MGRGGRAGPARRSWRRRGPGAARGPPPPARAALTSGSYPGRQGRVAAAAVTVGGSPAVAPGPARHRPASPGGGSAAAPGSSRQASGRGLRRPPPDQSARHHPAPPAAPCYSGPLCPPSRSTTPGPPPPLVPHGAGTLLLTSRSAATSRIHPPPRLQRTSCSTASSCHRAFYCPGPSARTPRPPGPCWSLQPPRRGPRRTMAAAHWLPTGRDQDPSLGTGWWNR